MCLRNETSQKSNRCMVPNIVGLGKRPHFFLFSCIYHLVQCMTDMWKCVWLLILPMAILDYLSGICYVNNVLDGSKLLIIWNVVKHICLNNAFLIWSLKRYSYFKSIVLTYFFKSNWNLIVRFRERESKSSTTAMAECRQAKLCTKKITKNIKGTILLNGLGVTSRHLWKCVSLIIGSLPVPNFEKPLTSHGVMICTYLLIHQPWNFCNILVTSLIGYYNQLCLQLWIRISVVDNQDNCRLHEQRQFGLHWCKYYSTVLF